MSPSTLTGDGNPDLFTTRVSRLTPPAFTEFDLSGGKEGQPGGVLS